MTLREHARVHDWYGRIRARHAVERGIKLLMERFVDIRTSETAKESLFGDNQYQRPQDKRS